MSVHARAQATHPPAALYQQIKNAIAGKIRDGSWKPGDRVSSEQELVAEFGVSRMTVNRALRELSDQGIVVRLAGVGTFVAQSKRQSTLLHIVNLADEIQQRGHDYHCVVVCAERVAASPDLASALGLQAGDPIFHTICLHRENGVPMQLEDRYVNPAIVPEFLSQDFARLQPSEYLLRTVPLDEVEHIVDAIRPTREQALWLELATDEPCLVLTRRTWTHGVAEAVTFVRCIHPGTRYRLGSRFKADSASKLS